MLLNCYGESCFGWSSLVFGVNLWVLGSVETFLQRKDKVETFLDFSPCVTVKAFATESLVTEINCVFMLALSENL